MNSLSTSCKIFGIGLIVAIVPSFSEQAISFSLIRKICITNLSKEIKESGFETSKELASKTCKCFIQEIKGGKSINNAKKICKDKFANYFLTDKTL